VARWYPRLAKEVRVAVIEAGPKILSAFDDALVAYYADFLRQRGVDLRTGVAVKAVAAPSPTGGASRVELSDGTSVPFGLTVWSAGLAPVQFVEQSSAKLEQSRGPNPTDDEAVFTTRRGRIVVDDVLRVKRFASTTTTGDAAAHPEDTHRAPSSSSLDRVFAIGDCATQDGAPPEPRP